jgi:hypothetical protein
MDSDEDIFKGLSKDTDEKKEEKLKLTRDSDDDLKIFNNKDSKIGGEAEKKEEKSAIMDAKETMEEIKKLKE